MKIVGLYCKADFQRSTVKTELKGGSMTLGKEEKGANIIRMESRFQRKIKAPDKPVNTCNVDLRHAEFC